MNPRQFERRNILLRRLMRVIEARDAILAQPPLVCLGQGAYGPPWLVKITQAEHLITRICNDLANLRTAA